jgi:PST family polysaccharide transporter
MATGLMGSTVAYVTIALITQYEGTQAVGLYSAAFALSGMFVNFVLGAMGADYYPRLTAAVSNKAAMNRMINEQTEIGLLLALPGLLATLALAPWILQIFYTREFLGAVELLQWFILGCMGRVISWPLGYIMIALGKSRWLIASESIMHATHVLLIFIGLQMFGLIGVAQAFAALYGLHIVVTLFISHKLTDFSWNNRTRRNIILTITASFLLFFTSTQLDKTSATIIGSTATFISFLTSAFLIIKRTEIHKKFSIFRKAGNLFRVPQKNVKKNNIQDLS